MKKTCVDAHMRLKGPGSTHVSNVIGMRMAYKGWTWMGNMDGEPSPSALQLIHKPT